MASATVQIQTLTLLDIQHKFGLQEITDPNFFPEWQIDRDDLSESDQVELDRAKHDFLYLTRMPVAEDMVKMVILAPLLSLAGFFRSPFQTTSEHPVELQSEEDGILYRGRIDVLVVQDRLWMLVIESKRSTFSLQQGIPQALAYLSTDPSQDRPRFALVTNGSHCRFLKQVGLDYGLSDEFSLFRAGNELYQVLRILRILGQSLLRKEN